MAEKYYAVKKGLKTGIFRTWEECNASINGYSGAVFKSFKTEKEARSFLDEAEQDMEGSDCVKIYVDGSYDSATGAFSYGMVVLLDGQVLSFCEKYEDEELSSMHNVAGEIKGAEAAMQYAIDHGIPKIAIYHDYEGIAKWCLGLWKTNKEGTRAYKAFYEEAKKKTAIRFVKVTGHSGDTYNEMADRLAREALGLV
ncbi:MAG: ribonuclease H family protein [Lachnospiraceae bacterium]|nr:ribonuclease H family protein [Lachnospiraceae bacterium]